MKAAVHNDYGPPEEVVAVQDVEVPTVKPSQVLVRIQAAGTNWADRSMTVGMPYVMRLGYGLRKPRSGIRGTDISGVVEKVGSKAGLWQVGDEVLGWGTRAFAEYAAVDEDHLVAKPASLSFEEAAAIPMAGSVALQAWRDVAKVEAGDQVLVVGASGGIGTFAVQIAKAMGARVTGVCSTPNVELVESLGADHVIDYTQRDFTDDARQYDAILDMADRHTLTQRRLALKTGGTLIPNSGEGGRWFGSLGRIFKAWLLSPLVRGRLRPFLSITKRGDLERLVEMVQEGKLRPVVGKAYPLADTGHAIAEAGSGHARGKVIVTP